MDELQQFGGGERSGYDARREFSKLLIDTIRAMFNSNNNADLPSWEMFCRNYYSITKKFIDQKTQEKCDELMESIVRSKYFKSGDKFVFNNKWSDNQNISNRITVLLMELQQELIQSTTHLLTPTKESDDEDFNPDGVI